MATCRGLGCGTIVTYVSIQHSITGDIASTYHMPVHALLFQELDMRALLQHFTLAKNINDIRSLDRGKTMCHGNRGPPLGNSLKCSLHELFALCCGMLV